MYETLRQLQVENKPIVTLFNKQDRLCAPGGFRDFRADYSILTSSKTGQGLEELREVLAEILREGQIYIERLYPYEKAGLLQLIRQGGELLEEEYLPEGISVKAFVSKEIYPKI